LKQLDSNAAVLMYISCESRVHRSA